MGRSGRSFAPVAARRDGSSFVLPEWLQEDDAPAAVVPHDHVLSVRSRPTPQTAADLAERTTPKVERLAPALRRLRAPRRIWARRAVVAGALVGSCAVLVSGIVLSSTGGSTSDAPAAAPARALPTADLREELWGGGLFTFGQSTLPAAGPITSAVSVGSADPGFRGPRVVQPAASDPAPPVVPSSSAPSPTPSPSTPTDSPTPTDPPTTGPPTPTDPPTSEPPTSDPPTSDDGGGLELPGGFPFS